MSSNITLRVLTVVAIEQPDSSWKLEFSTGEEAPAANVDEVRKIADAAARHGTGHGRALIDWRRQPTKETST